MKKKLFWNTSTALMAQFIAVLYGFVLPRLILEEYGSDVNGLTQSVKQFLSVISLLDMGLSQVVRSALYRPLGEKDHELLSGIMVSGSRFYRRIAYVLVAYVAVLMAVYPYLADHEFGWIYTATLIGAMAISTFAQYYFGLINEQLLHADQRGYIIYILQIATNIINAAVCVWMIRMDCSIHAVKLVTSLVYIIRPVAMELYIRNHYRIDRKICYSGEPIAQKWDGIAQHISAVVLDGTDTIVLTLFSTLSNVSVYSVYYMVISGIQQFYMAATAGLHSAAGALWVGQDRRELEKMFSNVETGLHFVTVFLFSCTGVLIVPFIQVYTDGLTDAPYLQPLFSLLLVAAYGVRCLRTPYNIWILASGHYRQTVRCHVVAAVLNLTISVCAVSLWGLIGVAVGTLIAMIYQTGWMALYNSKHLLQWPLAKIVRHMGVDILTALLIVLAARPVAMFEVSYFGWFVMAVQVGLIALVITGGMAMLFYRRQFSALLAGCFRRRKESS